MSDGPPSSGRVGRRRVGGAGLGTAGAEAIGVTNRPPLGTRSRIGCHYLNRDNGVRRALSRAMRSFHGVVAGRRGAIRIGFRFIPSYVFFYIFFARFTALPLLTPAVVKWSPHGMGRAVYVGANGLLLFNVGSDAVASSTSTVAHASSEGRSSTSSGVGSQQRFPSAATPPRVQPGGGFGRSPQPAVYQPVPSASALPPVIAPVGGNTTNTITHGLWVWCCRWCSRTTAPDGDRTFGSLASIAPFPLLPSLWLSLSPFYFPIRPWIG